MFTNWFSLWPELSYRNLGFAKSNDAVAKVECSNHEKLAWSELSIKHYLKQSRLVEKWYLGTEGIGTCNFNAGVAFVEVILYCTVGSIVAV